MSAIPLPEGDNAAETVRRLRAIDGEFFGNISALTGTLGNLTLTGDIELQGGRITTNTEGTYRAIYDEDGLLWYDATDTFLGGLQFYLSGSTKGARLVGDFIAFQTTSYSTPMTVDSGGPWFVGRIVNQYSFHSGSAVASGSTLTTFTVPDRDTGYVRIHVIGMCGDHTSTATVGFTVTGTSVTLEQAEQSQSAANLYAGVSASYTAPCDGSAVYIKSNSSTSVKNKGVAIVSVVST